jgi:integrase
MGKVAKKHVEGRTKEARIAVRKKLGSLQSLTVQSRTKKRYEAARRSFYSFLQDNHLSLPRRRQDLDPLVSEFIEHLWASGEGRSKANDTVAGLQDRDPKLRGNLPASWRLLKTWNQAEIPNRAPPLPEVVLQAMVGYALLQHQDSFALSLLLGFYCMLRTGELLGLSSHHISMNSPKHVAVLSLGLTKGGKRQGAMESSTLGVINVLKLLWKWKRSTKANSPLCPAPHKWRALFAQTLSALKLDSFGFRPYSLRRGGATHWFRHHGSFDKIMIQGRWAAQKTAKVYINEGLAILAELNVPVNSFKPFLSAYRTATE